MMFELSGVTMTCPHAIRGLIGVDANAPQESPRSYVTTATWRGRANGAWALVVGREDRDHRVTTQRQLEVAMIIRHK